MPRLHGKERTIKGALDRYSRDVPGGQGLTYFSKYILPLLVEQFGHDRIRFDYRVRRIVSQAAAMPNDQRGDYLASLRIKLATPSLPEKPSSIVPEAEDLPKSRGRRVDIEENLRDAAYYSFTLAEGDWYGEDLVRRRSRRTQDDNL